MRLPADTGTCGGAMVTLPFTDVAGNAFFCQIAEAYFSGLTNGTSATTYSPSAGVPREQMAAFITRTQDSALRRGGRRAALKQWATPGFVPYFARTYLLGFPALVESDGADLWVAEYTSGTVSRVRASDGKLLDRWTGASNAFGVLVAFGGVYVTGFTSPGKLYFLNPREQGQPVVVAAISLGSLAGEIATDGGSIWTANQGGSVSKADDTIGMANITTGFNTPVGILYDGANIWVTDIGDNRLKKLDSSGNILQSVAVGSSPEYPVFDGSNIWVPNFLNSSITVVRARDGFVLATLTGNGLNQPQVAAFDGQRILVTNQVGNNVSMWKAADLTPIGVFSTGNGTSPFGACSDGINFWITLQGQNALGRF